MHEPGDRRPVLEGPGVAVVLFLLADLTGPAEEHGVEIHGALRIGCRQIDLAGGSGGDGGLGHGRSFIREWGCSHWRAYAWLLQQSMGILRALGERYSRWPLAFGPGCARPQAACSFRINHELR